MWLSTSLLISLCKSPEWGWLWKLWSILIVSAQVGSCRVAPIEKTVVCITRVGWDIAILELSHHHFPAQFKVLTGPGVAGILPGERSLLSPSRTVVILICQMNLSFPRAEISVTDRRSYLEAPLFWNWLILEVCQCHSLAKQRDQNYTWLFTQSCELLHHRCRMLQAFEFKGQLFALVLVLLSIISTYVRLEKNIHFSGLLHFENVKLLCWITISPF